MRKRACLDVLLCLIVRILVMRELVEDVLVNLDFPEIRIELHPMGKPGLGFVVELAQTDTSCHFSGEGVPATKRRHGCTAPFQYKAERARITVSPA